MQRRLNTEPAERTKYVEILKMQGHTYIVANRGLLVWNDFFLMDCSIDGLVTFTCARCEGKPRVVEIKRLRALASEFTENKLKPPFYTQVQVQIKITNIPLCDFFFCRPRGAGATYHTI